MIRSVIFDFDGVIIDSEPLWMEAEIEIFKSVGVNLNPELCRQTTGLNTADTVQHWFEIYQWKGKSPFMIHKEIIQAVLALILEKAELKEGFMDVLAMMIRKNLPVAIASASPLSLISATLDKFSLAHCFKIIHCGDHEEFGKPHPAIYLGAARKIGIEPVHCLAFEDSFNGAISAKAARMKLVAVPDAHDFPSTRFDFADLKIASLKDFTEEQFERINSLN
jgi:mannitol-1-/sugar-/sorbitol-6-/2-deoxyglucose-6-phosphatase